MKNLTSKIGLPIYFDGEEIIVDNRFLKIKKVNVFSVKNLKHYYLNPMTVFPKIIYKTYWLQEIKRLLWKNDAIVKINIIFPEIVGVEYAKTKTIQTKDYPRILEVVDGQILVIMHPKQIDTIFSDDKTLPILINLNTHQKIVIPPDWYYTVINISQNPAIIIEIINRKQEINHFYKDKKGAPFYAILRNNNLEIVKNSMYKNVRKYAKLNILKLSKKLYVAPKTAIIKQFLRKSDTFTWFFDKTVFDWTELYSNYLDDIISI